jgi:REP element-mobilizing transposase RayT
MAYDPNKHHRRSIRLKGYDYSQCGAYFITICINHGRTFLGKIREGEMFASPAGEMVAESWDDLPLRFPNIDLDEFTIMPNHIHGIFLITDLDSRPNDNPTTLGTIIGALKSISTHQYIKGVEKHNWEPFDKKLWQRNYYDRIIRNERELEAIRAYIINNPANWTEDKLHPSAKPNKFNSTWNQLSDDL